MRKNLLIVLSIIFLDQVSKFLAPRFGFKVVFNQGIAFGLFPDFVWLIVLPLVLVLAVALKRHFSPTYHIPHTIYYILLILGGGFSNLIDRILFGAVRDWIAFPLIPTFNLADLAIGIGFLILVICFLTGERKIDTIVTGV